MVDSLFHLRVARRFANPEALQLIKRPKESLVLPLGHLTSCSLRLLHLFAARSSAIAPCSSPAAEARTVDLEEEPDKKQDTNKKQCPKVTFLRDRTLQVQNCIGDVALLKSSVSTHIFLNRQVFACSYTCTHF